MLKKNLVEHTDESNKSCLFIRESNVAWHILDQDAWFRCPFYVKLMWNIRTRVYIMLIVIPMTWQDGTLRSTNNSIWCGAQSAYATFN